jgi:hypothetical protein
MTTRGPIEEPREMVFVLRNMHGKKKTENAVYMIEQQGWECTVVAQEGAPGKCIIESKKPDYRLTELDYGSDCAFFSRVAQLYHADFDGWYAGGRPARRIMGRKIYRWAVAGAILVSAIGIRVALLNFAVAGQQAMVVSNGVTVQAAAPEYPPDKIIKTNADPSLSGQSGLQYRLSDEDVITKVDPATKLRTYYAPSLGVELQFPQDWSLMVSQQCGAGRAVSGSAECGINLYYKDWQQRYVPIITLQRLSGTLASVENFQTATFAEAVQTDPDTSVKRRQAIISGHAAIIYTVKSAGKTKTYVYIQDGDGVFGMLGETPKSSPSGLHYDKVFADILGSVKPMH